MRGVVWMFAAGLLLAAGNLFAARVTNVELSSAGGGTVAHIYVDGQIRYIHQTEVSRDGKPHRVIVDVLSAVHALGVKNFPDLPACPVTSIRTSQYAVSPEKIVRLVFDMSRPLLYKIDADSESIIVSFADKGAKPFASWSSAAWLAGAAGKPKPSTPSTSKIERDSKRASTVAEKNLNIEKDRLASLAVAESERESVKQSAPAAPKKSKAAVSGAVSPAQFEKPPVKVKTKSAPAEPVVAKVTPAPEVYGPELDETLLSVPESDVTPPGKSAAPSSVKAKPEKRSGAASAGATQPSIDSKDLKAQARQSGSRQGVSSAGEKKARTAGDSGQEALAKKVKRSKAVKPAAREKTSAEPAVPATQAAPPKEPKTTAGTRPTSRFRRTPAKIKGTMVAEFPRRLVIKYRPRLSRDPFQALVGETMTCEGPTEARVPSVEGLKLVGILECDGSANRALFEDKQDYSYILKSGDKVKKGYVLRVEDDRVYFQIFEYGWSRTVALTLEDF